MGVSPQEAKAIEKYLYPNAMRKEREVSEIIFPILKENPDAIEFYFKIAIRYFLKCENWHCCMSSFALMFDPFQRIPEGYKYHENSRPLKEAVKIKIKQLGFETGGDDLQYVLGIVGIKTRRPVKRIEYIEEGWGPFKKSIPREVVDYAPKEKEEILRELG